MNHLAAMANPFHGAVVRDAWQAPADVETIHHDVFEACLAGLHAAAQGHSDSLLIYGPAGAGKTHLLTRLQRYLRDTSREAADKVLRCVFVFVRLQTNPQLLWQHVRRRLVSDLLRKEEDVSQLQRLIAHQLSAHQGKSPRHWVMALRILSNADGESVEEYLAHVTAALDLGRNLHHALRNVLQNRYYADATAWLKGDSLPAAVLERLDLAPDEQEDREDEARQLVTSLCRLAGETLPIVFCFDQIEALERTPNDMDALYRFGRMAADLHDADRNIFLISCVQSALLPALESGVRDADKQRAFRRRIPLESLTRAQVGHLVRFRLDASDDLRVSRQQHPEEPYHPFDDAFVQHLAGRMPCVPRGIIEACFARFEEQRTNRPLPAPSAEAFLDHEFSARSGRARRDLEPPDATRVLLHGLPLLATLHSVGSVTSPSPPTVTAESREILLPGEPPVHLAVCNEENMMSLATRLRRLLARVEQQPAARWVIVRDARLPVPRTAKKTQEYLHNLEQRGVALIRPSPEALAAIAALSSLLSDAKSGDLSKAGEALDEGTVRGWLQSVLHHDPRFEGLTDFTQELTTAKVTAEDPLLRHLGDLLAHDHVVSVDAAAASLGCTVDTIIDLARKFPTQFGLLQGPPAVLLDWATAVDRGEA